ncbi:fructose-bisphosphatase class II [Prauserella muralis]|uniref:Fructose-1,6-bisphosphatase n=1 Tax=Prauserella muralis TaxID=588067 RepID=A0A2V4AG80_9PSEU|nr:fructose-bisphosphatase class II [Prauserella muralis]PXY18849.1 fructose 1,6-bisphosphatase [Prauserella muralis]TWE28706.1 fructose-1,6-bisphosphatase II [Prauserella muralis]
MRTTGWPVPGTTGGFRTEERYLGASAGTGGPDHALALELVPVTEAAAVAAGRWVGHGDENRGKVAAAGTVHRLITSVSMRGVVVVDEGGQPRSAGAEIGAGAGPACDVGISVGGAALSAARDVPTALAAIAVAERGGLYDPSPVRSMEKLAVGPHLADVVDIDRPVAQNLRAVAAAKGVRVPDVVVAVLNRPWHRKLVHDIHEAGARVHLVEGGEVAGAIAPALRESPVDMLLGTGGAAEGVIAAAALSCLGGSLQARPRPGGPEHSDTGPAVGEVLHTQDLVRGESIVFCATGVTDSEVLPGIQHHSGRAITQSIVLCSNPDTVRIVKSEHRHSRWRGHEEHQFA